MMKVMQQIFKNSNCRIGKKYPSIDVERISESEFYINGYTVYVHNDGSFSSKPAINDVILKTRVKAILKKLKKCSTGQLCKPMDVFDQLEQCSICKKIN